MTRYPTFVDFAEAYLAEKGGIISFNIPISDSNALLSEEQKEKFDLSELGLENEVDYSLRLSIQKGGVLTLELYVNSSDHVKPRIKRWDSRLGLDNYEPAVESTVKLLDQKYKHATTSEGSLEDIFIRMDGVYLSS
jgi:hypothetical protein